MFEKLDSWWLLTLEKLDDFWLSHGFPFIEKVHLVFRLLPSAMHQVMLPPVALGIIPFGAMYIRSDGKLYCKLNEAFQCRTKPALRDGEIVNLLQGIAEELDPKETVYPPGIRGLFA